MELVETVQFNGLPRTRVVALDLVETYKSTAPVTEQARISELPLRQLET